MPEVTSFDAAASAYETVRATVEGLKAEYSQVCIQIAETQGALTAAPLLRVPLADLKAGILDFVDAAGERYASEVIASAITRLACNYTQGVAPDRELTGKPLRFCDLDAIVNHGTKDFGNQLATPMKNMFDDRALYALFAPMMRERLATLMATMSPAQFGYDQIHPDKIGSDRETRRAEIAALNTSLSELTASRDDLALKLKSLGIADIYIRSIEEAANRSLQQVG